jgi:hypothetical protein
MFFVLRVLSKVSLSGGLGKIKTGTQGSRSLKYDLQTVYILFSLILALLPLRLRRK